ncbi:hypothetical protein HHK36_028185 [Tetracentron sinense]|uniref:Uncharacterized protein n=1 Tax=Tetracentron sinense TaxID=13715 RepID=A0A835D292_TETSI|nr:hypothetical protein HHK36_028185 [Tetracentron sinense]
MAENEIEETTTTHHETIPPGLNREELEDLKPLIHEFHTYSISTAQCSSLLAQRINAPVDTVWSIIRRFDKPQMYKHFIKSCSFKEGSQMIVGSLRSVNVISGLPAETSTERLDILDDDRRVTGFSIIGGEHRLRNYRSVTTVNEFKGGGGKMWTEVLESYVVDVPEGNTEEDTRMFADTVVRLNLQKLATVTERLARAGDKHAQFSNDLESRSCGRLHIKWAGENPIFCLQYLQIPKSVLEPIFLNDLGYSPDVAGKEQHLEHNTHKPRPLLSCT